MRDRLVERFLWTRRFDKPERRKRRSETLARTKSGWPQCSQKPDWMSSNKRLSVRTISTLPLNLTASPWNASAEIFTLLEGMRRDMTSDANTSSIADGL